MQDTTRRTPAGDDGIGAGSGAALVRTGLEAEVKNAAAGSFARLLERQYFGVLDAGKSVPAFACHLTFAVYDDRPNAGVGGS